MFTFMLWPCKIWYNLGLLVLISSCSAQDYPYDGFKELTEIDLNEDVEIIDYIYDARLGMSYHGILEINDTTWLSRIKDRLARVKGWECQAVIYMKGNKKFYKQYFDIDTSAIESAPAVYTCKKDLKNGRNGRVKICENRLYFHYFEVLDP